MRKKHKKAVKRPLTDQQRQAVQLMFDGEKVIDIAAAVGVHRCTIWRWYQRKDFRRELAKTHDKWVRDKRRETLREIRNSPEHKRALAARRRLPNVERQLEEAGRSHNMKAYRAAAAAYDKCISEAFFRGKSAEEYYASLTKLFSTEKPRKEKIYKVETL